VYEPSRYPSVRLDLSVVVPADIAIGDLLNEAATAGEAELSDISVFDVFTGPGVPTGHKR
jgi:phenylalanyl-tRNA synthetase beta subunit